MEFRALNSGPGRDAVEGVAANGNGIRGEPRPPTLDAHWDREPASQEAIVLRVTVTGLRSG